MGLDMYLEARFYLPPYDEAIEPIRKAVGDAIGYSPKMGRPNNDPTLLEVVAVSVRVGYWRKCEPLHQWFVKTVQEGHDDCRPAFVSAGVLAELEEQLDQASDDSASASEHFTVEEGGSLEVGEVDYTLEIIHHAKRLQQQGWDIYYRASW